MKSLRIGTALGLAIGLAIGSMTATPGRCATCQPAPCCKSEPSDQPLLLPTMPCCAPAKAVAHVAHPGATWEESSPALPAIRIAWVTPRPLGAPVAVAVAALHPPPLYRSKCALLL